MGCDIHGMFERFMRYNPKSTEGYWVNAGDPDVARDYELFAVIGNVRNYNAIPFIAENRLGRKQSWSNDHPELQVSGAFGALRENWGVDGHSHSYVTLREMKAYDLSQKYHNSRLVTSRDKNGKITSTCASTSGDHLGEVGEQEIFEVWGRKRWNRIIQDMEAIAKRHDLSDDEVRWTFFFDN